MNTLYKKLTNKKHNIGYKYILSLLITFVGLISFCSSEYTLISRGNPVVPAYPNCKPYVGSYVFFPEASFTTVEYRLDGVTVFSGSNSTAVYLSGNIEVCLVEGSSRGTVYWFNVGDIVGGGNCPDCPTCPSQYTSEECQSEYGLVSSGLLNNCENNYNNCQSTLSGCQSNTSGFNDLLNNCSNSLNACNNSLTNCLQQNCPETTTGINWSSLFINNIQYPGAPTIKFTIPEEIERDQYTDEEETNIDVIGYGYDQNKMQQMVNTQYYKPTSEEMSQLIGKIADFLPLIAVALLIIRIRRVLKKVFKF